jgi:hypothetical protein
MTWDAANIRVGINTSSPNSIFEVKSTGTGLKTLVGAFRDSSTNGNGIEIYNQDNLSSIYSTYYTGASNQDLGFFTTTNIGAQNEVLRLTSTQRVGISTSTPQYKLDITALGYGVQHYGDVNNSLRTYAGSGYQVIEATNSGTVNQFGYLSGGFYIDTSATARFRITTGGNVLINTNTNSGQTLQVNGNGFFGGQIQLSGTGYNATNSPTVFLTNTTATTGRNYGINSFDSGGFQIFDVTNSNATVFAISSSSNVSLIGSLTTGTPTGGTAAAWKLGSRVAATVVVNTTEYIEVDIGGTLYKLATVT